MKKVEELTLEEKVGQLFMVGLQVNKEKQIIDLIKQNKIGGIILYKRNYSDYSNMITLINNVKKSNENNPIPLFITTDQEGGRVNRIPDEITNLRGATKIAETKDIELIRRSGKIIGKMLRNSGITMDYAPILDIRRFKEKHAIGNRCYGENKEDVSNYAVEVMKAIQSEKVISVIKHFPGHGSTNKDSHFRIPRISRKIEELENDDMIPFERAIKSGAEAIMVGHLIIEDVDKNNPASLSKTMINKYLIEKYNYKGLIITDDIKMFAIRLRYTMKKATYKAIEAGNDIILMGLAANKVKSIEKYIIKKVRQGKIPEERINQSVSKILEMKEKYSVNDEVVEGFNIKEVDDEIKNINKQVEMKLAK